MRLLFIFFCATAVRGQQPVVESAAQTFSRLEQPFVDLARQWIRDPLPLHRAWAAKFSSRVSDPSLDAELIGVLGDVKQLQGIQALTTNDGFGFDEHRARLAVLDALIQRATIIPDEVGLALLPGYPAEAMILLYGRRCPSLATSIEIMRTAIADEVWLVAAGCLARQPGGPVELWQRAQVKVRIEVFDVERRGIAGGTPGGVLGRIVSSLSSWPPEISYGLMTDRMAGPGSLLLSRGPHPVYYGRRSNLPNWTQSDGVWHRGDRNQYALNILASQVRSPFRSPLFPVTLSARLHWLTPEQGRTDLRALATEQQQHYADLISGLIGHALLTSVERSGCP